MAHFQGAPSAELLPGNQAWAWGDGKIIDHGSYSGTAPRKFEYVKPFSKEWDQRQAEEQRRINAAITICRNC